MAALELNAQVKARGKDVRWYKTDIDTISEPARQLLETYSGIAPDQVIPHILAVVCRSPFLHSSKIYPPR